MSQHTFRAALRSTSSTRSRRLSHLLAGFVALLAMLVPVSTAAAISAPTGLHVQGATTTKLALAWDPAPNAKLYEFYRDGFRVGSATRNAPTTLDTYMLSPGANSNFTVRVTDASGAVSPQSAPINVTMPTTVATNGACTKAIPLTGANTLSTDINQTDGSQPCFVLASNSSLDCAGHTITVTDSSQTASVITTEGQHVLITNCKIKPIGSGDNVNAIHVGASSAWTSSPADYVSVIGNTVTGPTTGVYGIDVISAAHTVIANNVVGNAQIGSFQSPGLVVNANTITNTSAWTNIAAAIWIHAGDNAIIGNNTVNGGSPGTGVGAPGGGNDDGIILDNGQDNLLVRDNTLSHFYDAGIEPISTLTNSVIDNNTISYADEAGFGQYYGLWLVGNQITNNKISHARRAILMDAGSGLGFPAGHAGFSMSNNVFDHNTFTSPNAGTNPVVCINAANPSAPVTATGNVITNNNWGTVGTQPVLIPNTLATTVTGNTPNTYTTGTGC